MLMTLTVRLLPLFLYVFNLPSDMLPVASYRMCFPLIKLNIIMQFVYTKSEVLHYLCL